MILIYLLVAVYAQTNYPLPYYYGTKYKDFDISDPSCRGFYWSYQYHIGSDDNLWISNSVESKISVVEDTSSLPIGLITTITGGALASFRDGHISSAFLNHPKSLTLYSNATDNKALFIADTDNHCIRRLDLEELEIWEFAGKCQESGFVDGPSSYNRFNKPTLIGYDLDDDLIVFDSGNRYIRVIDLPSGNVTTLINGACRDMATIELTTGQSLPPLPYQLPEYASQINANIYRMACMKSMVKTTGEPSEHIFDEEQLNPPCLDHDILCGGRTHPLVAKDYAL